MPIQLAWRNLLHHPVRTTVALFGVAFAVTLIFMQLGFLGSVRTTASLIYNALEFDLVIRSPEYLYFADARDFPLSRLQQIQSLPEVESTVPFYVGVSEWRHPREDIRRAILTMGVPPGQRVFKDPNLHEKTQSLRIPSHVLIDTRSRKEFGPVNERQFSEADIGVETEIGSNRVKIIGLFTLGSGFAADGAVLLTDRGFARLHPNQPTSRPSLGLVKLREGADRDKAMRELQKLAAEVQDFRVTTREQLAAEETHLWVQETPIGIIFQSGVVLACVVGLVIVYQVLSSDVAAHLGEYATLKAMGYRNTFLAGVIVSQAVILSIVGYLPGLVIASSLYWLTRYFAGIPVYMDTFRLILVLGCSIGFCVLSGLGALWKVRQAEPADLF